MLTTGSVLADRFELLSTRGSGSMGTVYEARDRHLDRRVAIKVIQRGVLDDDEATRRFRREARLAARINHPGVPAVYDIGAHDGGLFLAMEYVEGALVRDLIAEAAPLPPAWAAAIGGQIAAVLARAHQVSLIHRDLKPSNLMLTPSGAVKVIDFGVAALDADAKLSTLTPPGFTIGTAAYQAPERFLGLYSPRSDLYSLGQILRELISDPESDEIVERDPALLRLVADLTAASADDRPVDARAVIARLRPLLGPVPPLPAFLHRDADVAAVTHAYLALAGIAGPHLAPAGVAPAGAAPASITTAGAAAADATGTRTGRVTDDAPSATPASATPASAAGVDHRRLRVRVEELVGSDRFGQAIDLLEAAIAAEPTGMSALDLRRDLTRVLFDSGDFGRASTELESLIPDLAAQLGPDHAAVMQARWLAAQALAYHGQPGQSLALCHDLLADQARIYGPDSRAALHTRRFIAILYAATGRPAAALNDLTELLRDQRRALGDADPDVAATRQLIAAVTLIP